MKENRNSHPIILLGRVQFVMFLIGLSCGQPSKPITDPNAESINLKEQIGNVSTELDRPFDNSLYQRDIESLKMEVKMFFALASIVNQALNSDDKETIQAGRALYEKVAALQEGEFPLIRKRYSVLLAPN